MTDEVAKPEAAPQETREPTKQELIASFINEVINPTLALHEGGAKVVAYDDKANMVTLHLYGGCSGCPASKITLYRGILPLLQEQFPGIEVELAYE